LAQGGDVIDINAEFDHNSGESFPDSAFFNDCLNDIAIPAPGRRQERSGKK
jgi:hypothetical protein